MLPIRPSFARVPLKEELVQIMRVREAAGQETRLIQTGKYKSLQRLDVKRAVGMMIENYDLSTRFVRAAGSAAIENQGVANQYGNKVVESLTQILEYFQVELTANGLSPDQKKFVLKALASTTQYIDLFVGLMPPGEVEKAQNQILAENDLNVQEFPQGFELLNPEVQPLNAEVSSTEVQ